MFYILKELYWNIKTIFFHKQKWLFKKIPNYWIDKDTLFEICIFEGLKHYVEKEIGIKELFDKNRWKDVDKNNEQVFIFETSLIKYYNDLTYILPALELQLEQEWKKIPHIDADNIINNILEDHKQNYKIKYGRIDELEEQIDNLKTEIMIWCVANRGNLWI